MKKVLVLSTVLLGGSVFGVDSDQSIAKVSQEPSQEHRSPYFSTQDIHKKCFTEKCVLAGKSLGSGVASLLFGLASYRNATMDTNLLSKESRSFERAGSLCLAGWAFVCAAKLGSYSINCAKEILYE